MTSYYPLFVNITGRNCIVVGGGDVAERKVNSLLEHGASVTVISSQINDGLAHLAKEGKIEVSARDYQYGDLQSAFIAVAATDETDINHNVASEGNQRGILINVVDDPEHSDFIVPSLIRRGDISIAISTSGKSPALSKKLRTILEDNFTQEYASLVQLISEVRQELKRNGVQIDADHWQECLDPELLLDMLKNGEYDQAKQKLHVKLLEGTSSPDR
jgi:siroheme synthase-like protein